MPWHIKPEWTFPWPAHINVSNVTSALLSFITNAHAASGVGTITNLDRSVSRPSGTSNTNARPRTPEVAPGKFYCEFEVTGGAVTGQYGVAEGAQSLMVVTTIVGQTAGTAGMASNSTALKVSNVTAVTFGGTPGSSRVRLACDPAARLLWMAIAGGTWNNDGAADPATGANGVSLAGFASDFIVPACGASGSSGVTATLYSNGPDWTYSLPSGFAAFPKSRPGFLNVPGCVGIDNATTVAVNYPTTAGAIQPGELLVLALSSDVVGSSFTTPAGWTAFDVALVNGSALNTKLFWTRAIGSGGETGTLNCVQSQAGAAGNCFSGSMMRFNNVIATGTPYEVFNSAARASASSITGLSVTPTATNRLAVTCLLLGNDGATVNDDGGNWTTVTGTPNSTAAGNDASQHFFIADPTSGVAVTAFSDATIGVSTEGNVYVFALIPAV